MNLMKLMIDYNKAIPQLIMIGVEIIYRKCEFLGRIIENLLFLKVIIMEKLN